MSTTVSSLGDLTNATPPSDKIVMKVKAQTKNELEDILRGLTKLKKESNILFCFTNIIKENNIFNLNIVCYKNSDCNKLKNFIINENIKIDTLYLKEKSKIDNVIDKFNENLSIDDIIKLYKE